MVAYSCTLFSQITHLSPVLFETDFLLVSNRLPSFFCLRLVLLLQMVCSLLGKQSSFLGPEKICPSPVGAVRYIFHILNVAYMLKWQHGICIRRKKFDFHTFVFFFPQVLQQLLQCIKQVDGSVKGHPTQWKSDPSSLALIPSLKCSCRLRVQY